MTISLHYFPLPVLLDKVETLFNSISLSSAIFFSIFNFLDISSNSLFSKNTRYLFFISNRNFSIWLSASLNVSPLSSSLTISSVSKFINFLNLALTFLLTRGDAHFLLIIFKLPIEIQPKGKKVWVKWLSTYSGQFELSYGSEKKTIVVESLF